MKTIIITFVLILMAVAICLAGQTEEKFYGKNLLRKNPNVEVYRENDLGIPVHVEGNLAASTRSGDKVATVIEFFENNRGAYKIDSPSEELIVKKSEEDKLGMTHIRFDQYHQGVRVVGGEVLAHYKASGELRTVNGIYEAYINLDVTTPSLTDLSAVEIAHNDLLGFFGETNPEAPELVVFPWQGTHYLCWRLFLLSDTPMGRWEYFVDATNGDVVYKANRIMDSDAIGTGIGVMGDPRTHIDTDYNGSNYSMIDYTRQLNNNPHGHDGEMPDGRYILTNLATTSLPGVTATDADNIWDDPNIQAPAVDGHVYTGLVYDWMLDTFDRNSYDDNGSSMKVSVNYSAEGDNNAYWNGSQIVIWSWAPNYGLDYRSLAGCPDVVAHEWGHAITSYESNLAYQLESGAVNESFSDMIGAAFEFAHPELDTPDWKMGENSNTSSEPFRHMDTPHEGYVYGEYQICGGDPDYYGTTDVYWVDVVGCIPEYANDYCGVHTNNGVGNKWFYLLSDGGVHHGVTVEGIGVQNAIKIAYRANSYYWSINTNYHQAALGILAAADDLDPTHSWREQALKAWHAVGVFPSTYLVDFTYPGGIPTLVTPGAETTFDVTVSATGGGSIVSGSGKVYASVAGGSFIEATLTETATDQYEVVLPPTPCEGYVRFYISVDEATNGTFFDPDPSVPLQALAITGTVVVFEDDFETDKGWTINGTAVAGMWERGVPVDWSRGDPPADFDGSGSCFLTDNDPLQNNSDVDDGWTNIVSPSFDLSTGDAVVHYARWLSNDLGSNAFMEPLLVYVSNNNGTDWVLAETVGPTGLVAQGGWYEHTFLVSDFVTPTDQMMVQFYVADNTGSIVEAAIDDFQVVRYECSVNPPIVISETLPEWTVNQPYSAQVLVGGGVGVLTFTDKYGDLASTDFTISSTGLVSGTPTATGTFSFTANVADETPDEDDGLISFTINEAIMITTTTLPEWTMNQPYSTELLATGGTGTRTWLDLNDDLVGTGLTLSETGTVSGTPASAAVISFTAQASDQGGDVKTQLLEITINDAVNISTSGILPQAYDTKSYSVQLESTGGTGVKTWSDPNDDLVGSGLTISATGLLSGTPSIGVGNLNFDCQVEDIAGSVDIQGFLLAINEPYICGDVDDDGLVNILDIVYLIAYKYKSGPAPVYMEAADVNSDIIPDGMINILDIVYLINFKYKGGPDPVCI